MLQDISELGFDSYLNATSANMQNEQSTQHDILCHGNLSPTGQHQQQSEQRLSSQPTSPLPSFEINAPEAPRFRYPSNISDCLLQGSTDFGLLDWDLNPSPNHSPHTVATDYTSSSHSPASVMLSPPFPSSNFSGQSMAYPLASPFDPPQHIRDEARKALAGYQYEPPSRTQNMSFSDFHSFNGNMPGIAIPATPIRESPPSHPSLSPSGSTSSSSLTSPLMPDQPLTAAFATIDQWQPGIKVKLEPNQDGSTSDHETRHWRKSKRTSYDSSPGRSLEPGLQLKKVAHNAIERRYRNNINDRIRDLKNVVPALYKAKIKEKGQHDDDDDDSSSDSEEIVDGVEVAKKLNKATILRKATEYITFLKHNNELADRENQILQQILAQMPGGLKVLGRFQAQKREFEKAEQERLARERKEATERERAERQRVLRERAAQRAALAQLIPKPERRPYRRRAKKQTTTKKTEDENGNHMFMAMFMCLVFFAAPTSVSSSDRPTHPHHVGRAFAYGNETMAASSRSLLTYASSLNLWSLGLYTLYTIGIIYICLLPLLLGWLRPRRLTKQKKCLGHHHYAPEVAQAWHQLYNSLSDLVPSEPVTHTFGLAYEIVHDLLVILTPRFLSGRNMVSQDDLSYAGAWVRKCELECLGGNPKESRLHMLRSCVGMFAQIKQLENDERHPTFFKPRTVARIFSVAAIQLELSLPSFLAGPLVRFCWRRVVSAVGQYKALAEHQEAPDHWLIQNKDMNNDWLESESHRQILSMVAARNNFIAPTPLNCSNAFYSFALPYLTSPLDWIVYWQTLSQLQQSWLKLLDNNALKSVENVFSTSQLPPVVVTPVDQMVAWWVHLGLALQKEDGDGDNAMEKHLAYLTDPKFGHHHPSSILLQRHRAATCNVLKAMVEFQKNGDPAHYLELALQDRRSSVECVRQIASVPAANLEASVLVLSSLAVNLLAFITIADHRFSRSVLAPQAAARYLGELRDQLAHDLALPLTKGLSPRCRKHIQSYISQADDALSM
ncbi:hypothetical protein EC973_005584 [Apophysomyces ossiformis]|uniref:BHLH domain-containing protein n=1 Tax=Apophysomyces ossiformis TaxID=679940 RepID=A0A8H7BS20_9FUNG|nr:hypothetical protein EC973_005584 [Apophysomyces ossiformis]